MKDAGGLAYKSEGSHVQQGLAMKLAHGQQWLQAEYAPRMLLNTARIPGNHLAGAQRMNGGHIKHSCGKQIMRINCSGSAH